MRDQAMTLCGEPMSSSAIVARNERISHPERWQPCAKPSGHDGGHIHWKQIADPERMQHDGYPLGVVTEEGELILYAYFDGIAEPEDIWPLLVRVTEGLPLRRVPGHQ